MVPPVSVSECCTTPATLWRPIWRFFYESVYMYLLSSLTSKALYITMCHFSSIEFPNFHFITQQALWTNTITNFATNTRVANIDTALSSHHQGYVYLVTKDGTASGSILASLKVMSNPIYWRWKKPRRRMLRPWLKLIAWACLSCASCLSRETAHCCLLVASAAPGPTKLSILEMITRIWPGVVRFAILHDRFTNRSMYYDDSVYNMNEPGSREALKITGGCVI